MTTLLEKHTLKRMPDAFSKVFHRLDSMERVIDKIYDEKDLLHKCLEGIYKHNKNLVDENKKLQEEIACLTKTKHKTNSRRI